MKLANHDGRAALVLDDAIADVHDASDGRFGPDPMSVYDDWPAFVDVRRRASPPARRRSSRPSSAARCPRRARCSPSGSTTGATPRSRAWPCPTVPATFTKFPASLAGPFDDIEIVGAHRRLGGRARRRHRHPRRPRRRGRRAGRTSPGSPSARTSATARCSSPPARSSRSASPAGASGRWGRGWSPLDEVADPDDLAPRLLGRRRDGAGRAHQRPHLQRAAPRRRAVGGAAAAARRRHLHRHAGRRRRHPQAAPVPAGRARCSRRWIEGIGTIRNRCVVTAVVTLPSSDVDLFADERPRRALRTLRARCATPGPVVWLTQHDVYAVPRYADVRQVLDDPDTFCSGQGVGLNDVINALGQGTTLMSDGDAHDRQREVIGRPLTPTRARRAAPRRAGARRRPGRPAGGARLASTRWPTWPR